jgi:hypothetical protein
VIRWLKQYYYWVVKLNNDSIETFYSTYLGSGGVQPTWGTEKAGAGCINQFTKAQQIAAMFGGGIVSVTYEFATDTETGRTVGERNRVETYLCPVCGKRISFNIDGFPLCLECQNQIFAGKITPALQPFERLYQ